MFKASFLLLLVILIMPSLPVNAATQKSQDGAWEVTSQGTSGSVGDTVYMEFSVTYLTDSYADTQVYIDTADEARQKVSFVGATLPTDDVSVSAERIEWPGAEFEAGVAKKFRIQARIDRGSVGDVIDGFHLTVYSGRAIFHGMVEDITIKVVAKNQTSISKHTPTPTPVKVVSKPTPSPTVIPTPVIKPAAQIAPTPSTSIPTPTTVLVNPIDPDGDGLPTDQEMTWKSDPYVFDTDRDGTPDGEEVRNGTNPAGDTIQAILPTPSPIITSPTIEPVPPKQSTFNILTSRLNRRVRAIGRWFGQLF